MNKTNLGLIFQIAQNLVECCTDLTTPRDTSAWRIVDGCCSGMLIANDASSNLPNGVTSADTECLSVTFEQFNHSGLGWSYIEDSINADEITSDITFTKENVEYCEDTGDVLSVSTVYEKVIPQSELSVYGFTFEYLVIDGCGCGDSETFPCGTDVDTLGNDICADCEQDEID